MKLPFAILIIALTLNGCSTTQEAEEKTPASINYGSIPGDYSDQAAAILKGLYNKPLIRVNQPVSCIMGKKGSDKEKAGWCFTTFTYDATTMVKNKSLVSQLFIRDGKVELFNQFAGSVNMKQKASQ